MRPEIPNASVLFSCCCCVVLAGVLRVSCFFQGSFEFLSFVRVRSPDSESAACASRVEKPNPIGDDHKGRQGHPEGRRADVTVSPCFLFPFQWCANVDE